MSTETPQIALTLETGRTFREIFEYVDEAGVPIDLTGCFARLQVRRAVGSEVVTEFLSAGLVPVALSAGTPAGVILLTLGSLEIVMPDEDTALFVSRKGVFKHDLELTDSLGDELTFFEGSFSIKGVITTA